MNPHTYRKKTQPHGGPVGRLPLGRFLVSCAKAAFTGPLSSALAVSFVVFAAGGAVAGILSAAHNFSLAEETAILSSAGFGRVLGERISARPSSSPETNAVYPAQRLAQNRTMTLTVRPLAFGSGKWQYQIEWERKANREGSLYISPVADRSQIVVQKSPAPREFDLETDAVFEPGTRYRLEFYERPDRRGRLLLRKFFVTPAGSGFVACTQEARLCPDGVTYVGRTGPSCEFAACPGVGTTTPPNCPLVLCAAPPEGCRYVPTPGRCGCGQLVCEDRPRTGIKLRAPNGGERWERGSTQTISWERAGGPVDLYLVFPRPSCLDREPRCLIPERAPIQIASGTTGSSFRWTVRDGQTSGTAGYKVRVVSREQACTASEPPTCYGGTDESDGFLTVYSGAIAVCDYAAPPQGCSYVEGPNFNQATNCGLELLCTENRPLDRDCAGSGCGAN